MTDAAPSDRELDGAAARPEFEAGFESYRAELTGYCYRMLGSAFDAEDAVQETLVRAWWAFDGFEGRAAVRSWLYRIATNVSLDMLRGRQRRARATELAPASAGDAETEPPLPSSTWVGPVPDDRLHPAETDQADGDGANRGRTDAHRAIVARAGLHRANDPVDSDPAHTDDVHTDPSEAAVSRETIRLAFVAALQYLTPRQRAVLLLRDVFGWHAAEVATLLDTSVGSVKSALQRARSTLAGRHLTSDDAPAVAHDDRRALVSRYVDAFERADVASMVKLLRDDAVLSMPPHLLWLQGPHDIGRFLERKRASLVGSRLVPVAANGGPAFAYYKASADGTRSAFAIIVLELSPGRISRIDTFIDADLFPLFNLPLRIDGSEKLATDEQRIAQPDEVEQGS